MRRLTVKKLFILFIIPALIIGIWTFGTVNAQADRICVCHVEDKDSGDGHVIEVDNNSLKGHLNHGDVQCSVDCETVVGDLSFAWGRYSVTLVPKAGGEPIQMEGRFSDTSRKINGKWLYIVDHASMNPPPPPPAK
ncbi:nuclear transport factor 2 family protein [bacterium]|nr:nuclear transport factor 2 family protein [bacterium]MCI0601628.1 nuclear transport factor 2 family protein [bacterium]